MIIPPEFLEQIDVARSFAKAAQQYDQHAHLQRLVGERLLERLEIIKMQPQTIVDVGCGTGGLMRTVGERFKQAQLYAVDIAVPMLHQARAQAPRGFWLFSQSRHFFVAAAAQALPFANQSVDLLISNLMLQWCNDFHKVFQEFARVLKPDGVLLFSTLGPDSLKQLRQAWANVDDYSHVNRFLDMHELGDGLLASGLTNPVMDVDWLTYHYPDVKSVVKNIRGIGGHNVLAGRSRGLTGKNKWQQMTTAYEALRQTEGLPLSYEVVYGHALGCQLNAVSPQSNAGGATVIPISAIKGRKL